MTTFRYALRSANPHESFSESERWPAEVSGWQIESADGVVTATGGGDASEIESVLRAWQASAYLSEQREILFEPLDGGPALGELFAGRDHVFRRSVSACPPPDPEFATSDTVERVLEALREQMRGEITPVDAGAAALDALEMGDKADDAASHNVDPEVVALLRDLVARGQSAELDPYRAYRGPEWQWLQEAVRRITLEIGRARSVASQGPTLTMADFDTELAISDKAMALQARAAR